MLSKTELLPARDRLRESDRHLAHVKGSLRHIKRVEDKQIVNDLLGAIEAQRKAVEQMLQVLDTVARSDFRPTHVQGKNGLATRRNGQREEERSRRLQAEPGEPTQFYFDVPTARAAQTSGRGLPDDKCRTGIDRSSNQGFR